jgi:hypothetical protein
LKEELSKLDTYEKIVQKRIKQFEVVLYKPSNFQNWTKGIQQKFDGIIPEKVHNSLAYALEKGIKGFLQGLHLIHREQLTKVMLGNPSLHDLSEEAEKIVRKYKRIASVEGAGTGFGGIIASTIDFPALISIKLKLLQELALLFGFRIENFEERVFILKVFQLQFSANDCKKKLWKEIKEWELHLEHNEWDSWENFDWREFYMEYKQSIEIKKLFQIIPGFGAIVGAWANYSFLDDLGETAILCYQMRYIQEKYGVLK